MAILAAAWPVAGFVWRTRPLPIDSFEWVVVERDDLETTLLAGGDLQPIKQTTVTCQVEDVTDTDGTMVLTVIDNGALVKKGDLLCRLDSSEIEELARQQEIAVNQARATSLRTRLVLETARLALREYEEGLVTQLTKEFQSRIALGRSDTQRQVDRLAWAEAMAAKGYLSQGQLLSERQSLARFQHELRRAEGEFQLFRRYQVPKEIRALRGEIEIAENNCGVENDRLKAENDELTYLRKQIENCTVRAPQDGIVVYALDGRWWPRPFEAGIRVYQNQSLFLIPDLSQMEVQVSVHESMGPRVRVGMKANVRIASLAGRVFSGRVASIDLLPTTNWKTWDEHVKHHYARIRLDKTPASALPLMSAAVEIDTGRVPDALVIPAEAVAIVDGQESCYVLADGGLERRPIKTRRATRDLLEVTAGLDEGERVVARALDVQDLSLVDKSRDRANGFAPETKQAVSLSTDGRETRAHAG